MMITASHNPKQYNGLKFCLAVRSRWGRTPASARSGRSTEKGVEILGTGHGTRARSVLEAYVDHVLTFTDVARMRP